MTALDYVIRVKDPQFVCSGESCKVPSKPGSSRWTSTVSATLGLGRVSINSVSLLVIALEEDSRPFRITEIVEVCPIWRIPRDHASRGWYSATRMG